MKEAEKRAKKKKKQKRKKQKKKQCFKNQALKVITPKLNKSNKKERWSNRSFFFKKSKPLFCKQVREECQLN